MDYLFLLVIIYMVLMLASSQIPPAPPSIDGPQVIVQNSQITLLCTSARGDPPPTVKWLKDDQEITTGISTTTAGTAVTTSLTFIATLDYHFEVLECQAENGVLQNPLSTTKFIEVHFSPDQPTLTGPTTSTSGQTGTWTCTSANGFPAGVMTMRNANKNTQFTSEFTSYTVLDQTSYDVTGTLTWSPVIVNNEDTICCDVTHATTLGNTPQTVCRQITIDHLSVVQINPSTYTATYGSQMIINCNIVSASPAVTQVYWQRSSNNQILRIDNGDQGYQGSTTSTPSLTMNFVTTANAGVYTCFASNAVGTGISNLGTVTVTEAVPTTNVEPRHYTATVGDASFQIQCLVTATPGATSWYWIFQPVGGSQQTIAQGTNDNQFIVDNSGTNPYLTIKSIALNEAGIYTCYATNSAGTSDGANNPSSRHTLTVTGG